MIGIYQCRDYSHSHLFPPRLLFLLLSDHSFRWIVEAGTEMPGKCHENILHISGESVDRNYSFMCIFQRQR